MEEEISEQTSSSLIMISSDRIATREDCLADFKFRCLEVLSIGGDLEVVKNAISDGECPFIEFKFEKDGEFRKARRHYRKFYDTALVNDFLKIIEEVENVKPIGN